MQHWNQSPAAGLFALLWNALFTLASHKIYNWLLNKKKKGEKTTPYASLLYRTKGKKVFQTKSQLYFSRDREV